MDSILTNFKATVVSKKDSRESLTVEIYQEYKEYKNISNKYWMVLK